MVSDTHIPSVLIVALIVFSTLTFLYKYFTKGHNLKELRISQSQFLIYWDKGSNNHADYWTKHWSPTYHQRIRPTYILKGHSLTIHLNLIPSGKARGCVENSFSGVSNPLSRVFNKILMP